MPSRPVSLMIVLVWLASTAWLIKRDILPALGVGDLTYEQALASRAVESPVEWTIYRGDEDVGTLLFVVKPASDSSYSLESLARIAQPIPGMHNSDFEIQSVIHVDPLKRLDRFEVKLTLVGARTEVKIDGRVVSRRMLKVHGQLLIDNRQIMAREVELAVDPRRMVLDAFGQLDQIPGLRPGKTWRTGFVNPLRAIIGGSLAPRESMDFIEHTVVATEFVEWSGRTEACYKVEHRYGQLATHSWVRESDGKVLIQEVHFAGTPFRLVANPPATETIDQAF